MKNNNVMEELKTLVLEQGVLLDKIRRDVQEVLSLLRPVSAHADWVESLRSKLEQWRILSSTPLIECKNSKRTGECTECVDTQRPGGLDDAIKGIMEKSVVN